MRITRIISVAVLALGLIPEAGAQLKMVSRGKLEHVNSPKLHADSASLGFASRHIVAGRMTEDDAHKTYMFEFTNTGRETIEIKRLVSTCSCVQAEAALTLTHCRSPRTPRSWTHSPPLLPGSAGRPQSRV